MTSPIDVRLACGCSLFIFPAGWYWVCEIEFSHMGENSRKIVSEYDQEIPQSQTADKPMAPRGRAIQQSRDNRKTRKAKQPAHPHCKTSIGHKT